MRVDRNGDEGKGKESVEGKFLPFLGAEVTTGKEQTVTTFYVQVCTQNRDVLLNRLL